jgi:hypothetical protein
LVSLTLGILKFLHPRVDLDAVGESFAATWRYEEALKLVEDFAETTDQVVDMLGVDMSLGWMSPFNTLFSPVYYIIMNEGYDATSYP